jgi:ABC transporter substrate binding protein/Lactonase, 7-bladed beta-propeller
MTLTLSLLAALLAAHAQSVAKTPRIGILNPAFDPHPPLEAFRQGLHDLGYVEGHDIVLEYRFADGRFERLPERAAELVRLKLDGIVAVGVPAVRAAQHTTGTIPVVFPAASDPVGQGLVASLAQPGGNITGVSFQDPELEVAPMPWNRIVERLKGLLFPPVMNSRPRRRPPRNAGSYRPTFEQSDDRMTPTAPGIALDLTATLTADNHYGLHRGQSGGAGLTFVGRNATGFTGGIRPDNRTLPETWNVQASTHRSLAERVKGIRHDSFQVLYATNWGSNNISAFRLNCDGTLQGPPQLFPAANGANNPFVAVLSPSGQHLYVSNWGSGDVSTYRIGRQGELIPEATTKPAGPPISNASGMVVSKDGERLFLAAFNGGGPGTVSSFAIDQRGRLSPLTTVDARGSGSAGVALSPDGRTLYVANMISGTVSVFAVRGDGSPHWLQTFASGAGAFFPALTPDGRLLVVANATSNDLSVQECMRRRRYFPFRALPWQFTGKITCQVTPSDSKAG